MWGRVTMLAFIAVLEKREKFLNCHAMVPKLQVGGAALVFKGAANQVITIPGFKIITGNKTIKVAGGFSQVPCLIHVHNVRIDHSGRATYQNVYVPWPHALQLGIAAARVLIS